MTMTMEYVYTNTAKEETRKGKGRSTRREGKMKSSPLSKLRDSHEYEALMIPFS